MYGKDKILSKEVIYEYYGKENKTSEKFSIIWFFLSLQDKNSDVQCFEETEQYRW